MPNIEKSPLINEAIGLLDDASERVSLAILFRDLAIAGEVEKAMAVRGRLGVARPRSDLDRLAVRYPALSRIGSLLAVIEAEVTA